jgi:hypothetical protein
MKSGVVALLFVLTLTVFTSLASTASPLIINSADTVVFDLSQATCAGAYIQIPVSILSDDTIYTLDFSLKYDHINLTYDSVANHKAYLNESSYYNPPDSTLRFTSWSLQQIGNNTPLVYIYFNLLSGQIGAAYLNTIKAYLNGDSCSVKIIDAVPSTGITAGGSTTFNTGDSVSLSAATGLGYTYLWSTAVTAQSVEVNSAGIYSVTITNVNGCSTIFSIDVNVNSILPVELLDFYAEKSDEGVLVSWTTASEINNDYFTVERSGDGKIFESVKKVKGAGNSTKELSYSCEDFNPLTGTSYYRLMQTDYDQRSVTSKTIVVNFYNNLTNMISLHPNPASDIVYVNVSWASMHKAGVKEADFMLRIFDVNGREAMLGQMIHLSYGMLYPIDVSSLPKGVYVVQLSGDVQQPGDVQQQELVIE